MLSSLDAITGLMAIGISTDVRWVNPWDVWVVVEMGNDAGLGGAPKRRVTTLHQSRNNDA